MFFGCFLMFIAVTIASVSAYFSVYGLAHIFAATFWSVVIMGGVLEVGKLVATSFLYRYWDTLKWSLRTYLLIAIAGLMLITSAGIFGYLSNAYQQDTVGVKDVQARIELLDTELTSLTDRDKQINDDIARIGSDFVRARQNLITQYAPEKSKITTRVAAIRAEKLELSTKQLEVEAHTGPIIYIAKAMNKGIDEAVMWMICLIIFVFDPLAVALTIGANIALSNPRPTRKVKSERPSYLDPELLTRVAEAGDQRLFDRIAAQQMPAEPVSDNQPDLPTEPEETKALEDQIALNQDLIETLSTDNQRLEDELFALASAFERKDLQLAQLKDAIRALEQQKQTYTIKERAELHAQNVTANKTQ